MISLPTSSVWSVHGLLQSSLHQLPQHLWPQPPSWRVLLGDPLLSPYSSNKTVVGQMVITNTEQETSVDIFVSGEVHFKGTMYFKGSVLQLHIGVLQIGYLWSYSLWFGVKYPESCWCCAWFYLLQTYTWGLFIYSSFSSTETTLSLGVWLGYSSFGKHRNEFQFPVGNGFDELWDKS